MDIHHAHPVEWLPVFQINTGTANNELVRKPEIVGLSNGNFPVTWIFRSLGLNQILRKPELSQRPLRDKGSNWSDSTMNDDTEKLS
ncbi:MAG: hypothetical protein V7695_20495 [Sulfitobacter sp.]